MDGVSDQHALPYLSTTRNSLPLSLYVSLTREVSAIFGESCGMLVYKVEKPKLSKCLAGEKQLILRILLRTCCELSTIQKQFTPVLLYISLQYSLK